MAIKTVQAYEGTDGVLYRTPKQAAEASCKAQLTKCVGNPGMVTEIMNNAKCVYDALAMLFADGEADNATRG
jgi:hypothetical protein